MKTKQKEIGAQEHTVAMENFSKFTLPSRGFSPDESSQPSFKGIHPQVNRDASQIDLEEKYIGWGCLEHNPEWVLTEDDVWDLQIKFAIPDDIEVRIPNPGETAENPRKGWFVVYEIFFDLG